MCPGALCPLLLRCLCLLWTFHVNAVIRHVASSLTLLWHVRAAFLSWRMLHCVHTAFPASVCRLCVPSFLCGHVVVPASGLTDDAAVNVRHQFWCERVSSPWAQTWVLFTDVCPFEEQHFFLLLLCCLLTPVWGWSLKHPHVATQPLSSESVSCSANMWPEEPEQRFSCHSPCPDRVTECGHCPVLRTQLQDVTAD